MAEKNPIASIPAAQNKASVRHKLILCIQIIVWLLIFEGALRKWIFPPLAKPLFFVRDPLLLYLCYQCIKLDIQPISKRLYRFAMLVMAIFLVLALVQAFTDRVGLATTMYGWRMYCLWLPFPFVVEALFTSKQLKQVMRQILQISILMAVIAFMQYRSPRDSFVNRSIDGAEAFLYGDLARVSGTFSFTQGHALFCHVACCFLLSAWLLPPKQRPIGNRLLIVATAAVALNVLVDGNRAVFMYCFLALLASTVFRFVCVKQKLSLRLFAPELCCIVGAVAYMTLFTPALEAMKARIDDNKEEGQGRIFGNFSPLIDDLHSRQTYLLGSGIGTGTPAGQSLTSAHVRMRWHPAQEENELGRIVLESGPTGLIFIAFRWTMAFAIAVGGFRASRSSGNPLPIILASFSSLALVTGSLCLNGTYNGFGWIFAGLSLAANRIGQSTPTSELAHLESRK